MGFMTVVTILNDGWETIKENKEQFVNAIEDGMAAEKGPVHYYAIGNHSNPVIVAKSQHADVPQLVLAQFNDVEVIRSLPKQVSIPEAVQYKNRLDTAERVLESAKGSLLDCVCESIIEDIKNAGSDPYNLDTETLTYCIAESAYRTQLQLSKKEILKRMVKYFV